MAVRGSTRGFRRAAAVRGTRVALDNYKSDGIKFGLYDGKWYATACDLLVASADPLEDVLKELEVYEVMDTRGLTI